MKDKGVVLDSAFDYATAFDSPPQWEGDLWRPYARDVGDRTYVTWKIGQVDVQHADHRPDRLVRLSWPDQPQAQHELSRCERHHQ